MTKETRIARDGLALEERRTAGEWVAVDDGEGLTVGHHFRGHLFNSLLRAPTEADAAFIAYAANHWRELAEAVIAMEAELERRRYITVGVRDLLFKSTDRNVWLLAATLNYACDDVEELPEDCLVTAALDPKQGAADGER